MKKLLFFLCLFPFLVAQPALAYQRTINATGDTYIDPQTEFISPVVHGGESTILVQQQTVNGFTSVTYAFVKFANTPFSLMSSEYIANAKLVLNLVEGDNNSCQVSVQRSKDFSENDTTATLNSTSISSDYDKIAVSSFGQYFFDITQLVKDWQQGKYEDLAVMISASGGSCQKKFASLQFANTSQKPIINVEIGVQPTLTPSLSPVPTSSPTNTPAATSTPHPSNTPTLTPTRRPSVTLVPSVILTPTSLVLPTGSAISSVSPTPLVAAKTTTSPPSAIFFIILGVGIILLGASSVYIFKAKHPQSPLPPSKPQLPPPPEMPTLPHQ